MCALLKSGTHNVVLSTTIGLRDGVMRQVLELAHDGPDHTSAFQLKFDKLTLGDFVHFVLYFAVELGLKRLGFEFQLRLGKWI